MKSSKTIMAACVALALVGSIAACGSDDGEEPTATAASTSAKVALPKPAELNTLLDKALDPKVPLAEKRGLVEDGDQAPPAMFDALVKGKRDNPGATYEIVPPISPGPNRNTAIAKFNIKLNPRDAPINSDVTLVYQKETWRLSKASACVLLSQAKFKDKSYCP